MLVKNKKILVGLALIFSVSLTSPLFAQNEGSFNPNNILSDAEMLDANSMTLAEIDAFLKSKGGFIAFNKFPDPFGATLSAAELIYNAAHNFECDTIEQYRTYTRAQKQTLCRPITINPKFLLVLLQKEQSLIEAKTPTQKQLDWATGYAICDSCSMDDPAVQRYKGFGKQVNSAALQFISYMREPNNYRYRAGQTYTVTNTGRPESVITPVNQATAGLYNYTPHVYNGNFNFWKLWQRYFSPRDYLNGSLLQASGEAGVWLIENNFKRPFLTRSALTSRFDTSHIQIVSRADLDKFPTGEPIKFAQYSIVRIPTGQMYLLVDNKKRRFTNPEAFRRLGFNPAEIIQAQASEVVSYAEGTPITEASAYPTGALLQDRATGGIFWMQENTKAPLWDSSLLRTKFKGKPIIRSTAAELNTYQTVAPVRLNDGELVRTPENATVYVIENGIRRPFLSADAFQKLGYKWTNVVVVSNKLLSLHAEGPVVTVAP